MKYRPEIDGLRAIAVLPVILFHAGIPFFSGGYIGVDVFFVISGYLITTKIMEDISNGKFSLLDFYEKRARRILPLFITIIIASIPVFYALLAPSEYSNFVRSAFASMKLMSDVFFRRSGNYFEDTDIARPLLHTWSLSIEEKYYLAFPVLVIIALKFNKHPRNLLPIFTAVMFLTSLYYSETRPADSYYMFFARIWEILAGANVAVYSTHSLPAKWATFAGWASMVILGLLVVTFGDATPYPGAASALPVMATILIIISTAQQNSLAWTLSARPFVFIGLISYSLYMWHQPVLVALTELELLTSAMHYLFAFSIIAVLSLMSWKCIELPARQTNVLSSKAFLVGSAITIAIAIAVLKVSVTAADYRVASITPPRSFDESLNDTCFLASRDIEQFDLDKCSFKNANKFKILVIGDSHSIDIFEYLKEIEPQYSFEVSLMASSYCQPLVTKFPENQSETADQRCAAINKQVQQQITSVKPDMILLSTYMLQWSAAAGNAPMDKRWTYDGYYTDFLSALKHLNDVAPVTVVGTLPIWKRFLPDIIAGRLGLRGVKLADIEQSNSSELVEGLFDFDKRYSSDVKSTGAAYLSVLSELCPKEACPWIVKSSSGDLELSSFDYGHLSDAGARAVVNSLILPEIADINQSLAH